MKPSLQLKLGQSLTMTPQLQQAIRLLQLSTLDLQAEIQEALESNPMLEMAEGDEPGANAEGSGDKSEFDTPQSSQSESGKDNTIETSTSADANGESAMDADWSNDIPDDLPVDTNWDDIYTSGPASGSGGGTDDDRDYERDDSGGETLQEHLLWQLNLTPMSDRDRVIAMSIIDAIEPSGLLASPLEEIADGLHQETELQDDPLEMDEVLAVLHRLQQFDPPGVAGQDLSECLLIQLRALPATTPLLDAAKLIVKDHLALLGSRDYKQLMRRCKLKEAELAQVIGLIQTLNPRPGETISRADTEYVIPDVFVSKKQDRWLVELNPDIAPKIRINSGYASLVKRADTSRDNNFLRDNLQEARWFLKSLQSRNETLLKVATCIVEKQVGFFEHGPEAMKPMVLHDIAEEVGMHESTISRVTTQKYMHTPQGIFELKYFFSSHVSTDSGGECSSTAIRAIIKKLVAAENPKKPLSDSKITKLLEEQGIQVARRTIAKYRESLGIAASNERKRLI
ncbi:RNA polymerase factor sigma-54 [Simiduia aestuariiviva]|uniref:RNA polymerase sigma-54 factor n=1 Tax=Simiduia aestuariiviva TaxID=1510459 RepID=A0A839UUX0_9GAMM|nr:RNA polymerase factor sigma-54 [Simiduia aestuariiviva]MBB3169155.1 RNA polymerase sigma-54 factor [Simiduia aestuariiviva]